MAEVNNNKSLLLINGQQQQQQPPTSHQFSDNFIIKNNNSCPVVQSFQNIDRESLLRLESLISEFFLPITCNERKRQIEQSLAEFSNTPNSWQLSFVYFEHTSNEYTKMFCLTVIESFINQRWHTLSTDIRQSFRSSLWKHLFENHANITPAIRNKFCKILVTIARYDWPYQYPDFMSNILELLTPDPGQNILHSATLILLGLNLLGTAVEELSSNKSYHHNHFTGTIELVRILQSQLPNMLQALTLLLESIISKHVNYYSATPPPSPTSIHNQNSNSSSNSSRSNAGSPPNILSHITKSNDTLEFVHLTSQIFVCLSQIIDFMPVSYFQSINSTLLSALYVLATFGSINPSYNSSKLGLISMNCINELISKVSTFDSEANEFIYNVFHNTFIILQLIVSSSLKSPNDGETRFDEIDEDYLKKFIDFLKLFIIYFDYLENYINQITGNKHHKDKRSIMDEKFESIKEPILSFLLFILRSIQYSCNHDYLKHLDDQTLEDDSRTELQNYFYRSIEIVAKIADIYPEETISYIDNYYNEKLQNLYYGLEFLVNNNNKPLSSSSSSSSSMMMVNGKSYCSSPTNNHNHIPIEQLKLHLEDFIITLQMFSRFANFFIDIQFEKYFIRTKMKFDKLCEILHFIEIHKFDDDLHGQTTTTNPLLSEFLLLKAQIIATFKAYIVWYQQVCCASDKHSIQLAQAIDHITIIINTCCSIICDTNNCSQSLIDHQHSITANSDLQLARISKCSDAKKKMFHSAALTLNTFSANVRPSFVFNLQSVQRLFDQNFQSNLLQLNVSDKGKCESMPPLVDKILISQSISNFLILPWFQLSNEEQNWERRSICFNMFIGNFLHLFNNIDLDDSNRIIVTTIQDKSIDETSKCPNVYCRSLYILKQVIKSHSESPLKSKQMLLISLNSSLEAFIQLLAHNQLLNSTIIGCQITKHILALFIVVFKVLLSRIHTDFVERTIQTLLQIINRHNFMTPISRDTNLSQTNSNTNNSETWPGLRVIIKFLKLLILVIGQPSLNSFIRTILPDIIDFAVIRIQTTMINSKSPMTIYFKNSTGFHYDIYHKMLKVYYRFLYELLLNNCRYFFPQRLNSIQQQQQQLCTVPTTTTTTTTSPIKSSNDNYHDSQQQRHFDSIMEIIGESFLQPENIHLFRQNVDSLESMNQKLKLYERLNFREKFWERFLYLFMQTLNDHSLDLLQESLFTIIFHMAQVDFIQFYESFMPKFLSNLSRLNDQQRLELMTNFKIEQQQQHHHLTHQQQIQIDFPTFSSKLNQLLCNVRFFYKCNN
ncbi:Exportin-6 [Dermatophagoides pteronyssinus]|uniref:Exportin-6 n=1 Tax=Dermatophagoides pteronyssinus TaxID=6956 RepID=A0ABQ8J162_DERPT|nr:Exportin-6 [Dermatophagoides pteronyssinus]